MLYPPTSLVATAFSNLAADTSTNSASYVSLITAAITTPVRSSLIISFSCSAGPESFFGTPNINFQLVVDGVPLVETKMMIQVARASNGIAMFWKTGILDAGVHTATINWKTAGGTVDVNVVTGAEFHHASLLIEAVTV